MQRLHETSVAPRPLVIVLTGGPSSGKSSALAPLRSKLSSIGFQVMIVPETATHFFANSDGFQAEWEGVEAQVRMQRIFIDYQLMQEEAFIAFAQLRPQKPAIVVARQMHFGFKGVSATRAVGTHADDARQTTYLRERPSATLRRRHPHGNLRWALELFVGGGRQQSCTAPFA